MQVQQLSVKLFLSNGELLDTDELIPIFHRWIREHKLGSELVIDVADYRHVPKGPGLMMVGHEGHYAMDEGGAGIGLSYSVKRDEVRSAQDALKLVVQRALNACALLEAESSVSGVSFDTSTIQVQVMSRLVASNDDAQFALLEAELTEFFSNLYGNEDLAVSHLDSDPRAPLGATVTTDCNDSVATLLERLSA